MRAGTRRAAVAALAIGLVAATGPVALAAPSGAAVRTDAAVRSDDPTWADVPAAKKDVAKQKVVVARIEQDLSALEATAAQLGDVALQRAEEARAAETALERAQAVTSSYEQQAAAAKASARTAKRTAGAVATQLVRAGDPQLSLWLSGQGSGSLLYRLGALTKVGDASGALLDQARAEERDAQHLGDQAADAAHVRDTLSERAAAASALAKAAQRKAQAQVKAAQGRRAVLTAQLAALQATYDQKRDSYAAVQAAKAAAARAGRGGGGGSLSGIAAGPDSLSPAGAQAYASSRLGAFGWGAGEMGCLVSLWNIESGWRWDALNAASGAYGIPQALPGDKMATSGGDWTTSSRTQIDWGLGYIQARYGTPCGAYRFETSHTPYWY